MVHNEVIRNAGGNTGDNVEVQNGFEYKYLKNVHSVIPAELQKLRQAWREGKLLAFPAHPK